VARKKLVAHGIAQLPEGEYWDALVAGLHLRVSPKGRRTFAVRYRVDGSQRREKIGIYHPGLYTLAQAREDARARLTTAAAGFDPRGGDEDVGRTFGPEARRVLERRAKVEGLRESTVAERTRVLDKILVPAWDSRDPAEITRTDVKDLRDSLAGTPTQANRAVAIVSLIFNELLDDELVSANPAHRISKLHEPKRSRWLGLDEIGAAWKLFDSMGLIVGGSLKLTMLTAQRIGSVRAMRWADVHGATWRIPAEYMKGRREHWVPLSAEARALLDTLPATDGAWVFPALRSDSTTGYVGQVDSALYRAVRKSKMEPFRAHDLRETFRTWVTRPAASDDPDIPAGCGIAPEAADAVLAHREQTVALAHYHGRPEEHRLAEKREALTRWGAFVRAAVEAKS
jgi:integrase